MLPFSTGYQYRYIFKSSVAWIQDNPSVQKYFQKRIRDMNSVHFPEREIHIDMILLYDFNQSRNKIFIFESYP
jgi:hypothetical protein